MKKIISTKSMIVLVVFTLFFISLSQAHAASVTLTLSRVSLTNVGDTAGLWQYEGGKVLIGGTIIGDYAVTRRVTTGGTDTQNTAMLTMTIFLKGKKPPQNITLQGSHDYSSGGYIGSVSAASSDLSALIGANISGSTATDTLTITY